MTKTEDRRPKTKDQIIWIIFGFAVIFVYFFALGSIPLLGPDESRYAQVALEHFTRDLRVTRFVGTEQRNRAEREEIDENYSETEN